MWCSLETSPHAHLRARSDEGCGEKTEPEARSGNGKAHLRRTKGREAA